MLQSVTEYNRVLQSITEYYGVLQSITEYYRVLQSITKYYKDKSSASTMTNFWACLIEQLVVPITILLFPFLSQPWNNIKYGEKYWKEAADI